MVRKVVSMTVAFLAVACGRADNSSSAQEFVAGVRLNEAANNCEFYVDGLADIYNYNQGWSRNLMHVEVVIRDQSLGAVGMWIRYRDKETGEIRQTKETGKFGLTPRTNNERWVLEFAVSGTDMPPGQGMPASRFNHEVLAFALFGEYSYGDGAPARRVWMSKGGLNFSLAESMAEPTFTESLGRGRITWSNQKGDLFDQKRACERA